MTLNERVRHLRQDVLNLSQREFAEKIGIKQSAQSAVELSRAAVTDRNITVICSTYNVREEWLRDGTGEIFQKSESFSLDQFVRDHGGTDLELEIIRTYFELPEEIRRTVLEHFKSKFSVPSPTPSVKDLEEEYKKTVLNGASNTTVSASNTTKDSSNNWTKDA